MKRMNGGITWSVVKHWRILLMAALLVFLLVVTGTGEVVAQHAGGIDAACGAEAGNSGLCEVDFSDHPGYNGNHG